MRLMYYFIVILSIFMACCYNEKILTPTEESEFVFHLPQGDHDYDAIIVDWNSRCGFYILYQFEPQDIYWNLTAWEGITWLESSDRWDPSSFKALPAEETYVGKQLDLLEEEFFNFYPDSVLQEWMPLKLLLRKFLLLFM